MSMHAGEQRTYRRVEAGRALAWWREGWQSFWRAPWIWLGLCVLGLLGLRVLHLLPLGAVFAQWLSLPLFALGAVFAAGLQRRLRARASASVSPGSASPGSGNRAVLEASTLVWRRRFAPLLVVSLLVMALMAGALLLSSVVYVLAFRVGLSQLGQWLSESATPVQMIGAGGAMLGILAGWLLLVVLLLLLGSVVFWFAGTLVSLGGLPPVEALLLSARAGWANAPALLLFTLLLFPAAILALLPAGLGMLVLFPVLSAASYASFEDIFGDDALSAGLRAGSGAFLPRN